MSAIEHDRVHGAGRMLDRFFTVNWVFSAPRDLVFLIGSVLAGWAVFGIYLLLGWNMILVWLIWVIVLDTTTWIAFYVILTSGFQMHHYLLDQYIWRPGKDRRLREDLKIEETGAPA